MLCAYRSRLIMCKIVAILLVTALIQGSKAWTYKGPEGTDHWADNYEDCGGDRQSPIDIRTMDAEYQSDLAEFEFHGYDSTSGLTLKLKNNGHAAQVDIVTGDVSITGGDLNEPYRLAQFHFHWGSDDHQGSEHTVNGKEYPMEVHFVHFANQHADLVAAADKANGLAVLGFFFEVGGHNEHFDEIINNLGNVEGKGQDVMLSPFKLMSLLPDDVKHYYRYDGSLTTPGCYESVIWTVFDSHIEISSDQLAAFRTLMGEEGHIVDNYRPVQPLNGRAVKTNIDDSVVAGANVVMASLVTSLAFALLGKLL